MKLVELQCGTIRTWRHLLVRGASEGIRFEVPVKCFYIEHAGHRLLFDAGQKPLSYKQPDDANYLVKVAPHETAAELLRSQKIAPESIGWVVLSHLHADHTAGAEDFPQSEILLQQAEVQNHTLPWQNVRLINGGYDLFNDERIILLPTAGHTPGHQSLLITMDDSSKIVLTGDAAYTPEALTYRFTEQEYQQNPTYFDSLQQLRELQKSNVKLIYSHL